MDMEDLRFPDASFDGLTCAHGLQFVPDLDRALREAHRVLRKGGRFATTVPHERTGLAEAIVDRVAGGRLPPPPDAPDRARTREIVRDPDAFRAHLERAGFEGVRAQVIEEEQRWNSPAELITLAGGWWLLAARLEQVSAEDRASILAEAQRALEEEHGPGPLESRVSSLLLLADA
jgi:SAM-dependent methyltransferase